MATDTDTDWKLVGIPVEKLADVWGLVFPWLKDVEEITDGMLSVEQLADNLADGRNQLFIVYGEKSVAAIVTEILTFQNVKYCNIILASGGGNAKKWAKPIIEQIETWAKNEGCDRTQIFARKAWLRLLPDYRIKHYRITKEL